MDGKNTVILLDVFLNKYSYINIKHLYKHFLILLNSEIMKYTYPWGKNIHSLPWHLLEMLHLYACYALPLTI